MPEGDRVWLTARRLDQALSGRPLLRADLRVPRHATAQLAGRTVSSVVSCGKHLLTRFDDGQTLHTHLGMDGTWRIVRPTSRRRGGPAFELRVHLENTAWAALGYRLKVVDLLPTTQEERVVGHLGPDLLGPDWDEEEAVRRIAAAPDREIGLSLLDQRNLAGIGNVYQTELCFLRGVTPWTPVAAAGDVRRIVALAHKLLNLNRGTAEMITTGNRRPGQRRWIYEQSNCLRCGTPVRSGMLGEPPKERLTYWCPHCQRGPGLD